MSEFPVVVDSKGFIPHHWNTTGETPQLMHSSGAQKHSHIKTAAECAILAGSMYVEGVPFSITAHLAKFLTLQWKNSLVQISSILALSSGSIVQWTAGATLGKRWGSGGVAGSWGAAGNSPVGRVFETHGLD